MEAKREFQLDEPAELIISEPRRKGFAALSKSGMRVIRQSLLLSLTYNAIGLSFAVSGHLIPVVAAILMPISAISVVIWTSTATAYLAEKKFKSLFQR